MLTPLAPDQWDRDKAAHLLNRAGFGGPPQQIDALARGGMPAAISKIVDGPATPVPAPAPDWAKPRDVKALKAEVMMEMTKAPKPGEEVNQDTMRRDVFNKLRKVETGHIMELGNWWMERMTTAQDPLEEKMTLFWHGHFATSAVKVKDAYLMWRQNQTFREHARANFGVLVKAMSRDPAMIQWLDLRQSKPEHANENFARELMELFTLGEGNYSEKDVTESARAFTGYRINPDDQAFQFIPTEHDFGPKEFLGHRGNFHGDQIIDLILAQPACAHFMAKKLWTFFAYENPSPALVDTLAETLRGNGYEMRPTLRKMFASAEFYSPQAIGTQVKSPVQFMVQNARLLGADLPGGYVTMGALKQLGQVPFAPPNVKGWDGGKAWISTATLLARYNLSNVFIHGAPKVSEGAARYKSRKLFDLNAPPAPDAETSRSVDLAVVAPPAVRTNPTALVRALSTRLFASPLPDKEEQAFVSYLEANGPADSDRSVQGVLHLMMSTPRFQLC